MTSGISLGKKSYILCVYIKKFSEMKKIMIEERKAIAENFRIELYGKVIWWRLLTEIKP